MKKIKKLTLNKEVVSILGGNDMNLVKGGTNTQGLYTCPPMGTCVTCATNMGCGGGGGGGGLNETLATCQVTCVGHGCDVNPTVGCAPASLSCAVTCNGNCASNQTCGTTCPASCPKTCDLLCYV